MWKFFMFLGVHLLFASLMASCQNCLVLESGEGMESQSNDAIVSYIPQKPGRNLTSTALPDPFDANDPTTQAKVTLRSDLFRSDQQNILYYAVLLTEERFALPPECGFWNSTGRWPPLPNWENSSVPYQVTPVEWNPFDDTLETGTFTTAVFVLGDDSQKDSFYWNKPLTERTKYAMKIRAFTEFGFQDTDVIYFETLEKLPVLRISSILITIWIITTFIVCCSVFDFEWIKRLMAASSGKSKDYFSPVPETLSHKSFLKYAEDLLNNPGRLGNEFHLLGTLSSDVSTLSLHAQRVDNKKKNRYGNIVPFDMTRVKLSETDDDPSTDYINASFIKGHTQEVEYIACQGPQAETCHDFYRMIVEQNIEIIVMLTDLIENGREKCYKYYPDEGQILSINDVSVFCDSVEELELFTRRILTVIRGQKKMTVTQFQYKHWTDFLCPRSPSDMLKFRDVVHQTPHRGYIVVHCSAGAGRTGTFIAMDILLQRVRNNSKINVFNTVLKLRQQRVGMVQTESQLGYIYRCVSRAIEACSVKPREP